MLFKEDMTLEDLTKLRNDLLKLESTLRQLADQSGAQRWTRLAANLDMAADRIERAIGVLNARLLVNVRLGQ